MLERPFSAAIEKAVSRPMDGLKEFQSNVKHTVRKIILRALSKVKRFIRCCVRLLFPGRRN